MNKLLNDIIFYILHVTNLFCVYFSILFTENLIYHALKKYQLLNYQLNTQSLNIEYIHFYV